jgi:hypothetical protein
LVAAVDSPMWCPSMAKLSRPWSVSRARIL